MRAILETVSPAADASGGAGADSLRPARAAVLLDIDGTLAPIVRHAADAQRARGDAHAADRGLPPLRRGRMRQRAPGRDGPADRRDRDARLCRQSRRRAAAARAPARRGRPGAAGVDGPRAQVRRAASSRPSASGCVCAARTRTRSPPSTGAARPMRTPPSGLSQRDRRPRGAGGLRRALGAQGARGSPAGGTSTRAWASRGCSRGGPARAALYVGDDSTDLDAFAGLRSLVGSGDLEAVGLRGGRLR